MKYCTESLESDLTHVFMKATDIQSSPKEVFKIIAKMVGKKCSSKNIEQLEKVLSSGTNSAPLLLIIDEIDFLLSGNNDIKSDVSTVLRWASDPKNRLAVIGISNSVGDDCAKSLHRGTKVSTLLVGFLFSFITTTLTNSFVLVISCRFMKRLFLRLSGRRT